MTITLSWWAFPVLILVVGLGYAWYDDSKSSGYFGGLMGFIVGFASVVAAVSIVIGHYL